LIGTHTYNLAVRLTDYPAKGYFPKKTPFTVTVQLPTIVLTPIESTSFNYFIGSRLISRTYKINLNYGTTSFSVNGQTSDIENKYGITLKKFTENENTLIEFVFNY
jgi:hypothetical protein